MTILILTNKNVAEKILLLKGSQVYGKHVAHVRKCSKNAESSEACARSAFVRVKSNQFYFCGRTRIRISFISVLVCDWHHWRYREHIVPSAQDTTKLNRLDR